MGTDIQPDIYVGRTGTGVFDGCYWARLSGATGDFDEIIANGSPVGQFYVEIKATDAYFQTGCEITPIGDWPKPAEALTKVEAGMYMVGRDIAHGIYAGFADGGLLGSCYWSRLSSARGAIEDVLANGSAEGQFYVEIQDTDAYFQTGCEITAIEDWPKPAEVLTKVEAGMYMVGRDIAHGIYAGFADGGLLGSCYWSRLSSARGDIDDVLANGSAEGQFYVEIQDTDAYFQTGCEITALAEWPSPDQPHTTVDQGIYLVGRDIGPGTYRGEAGQGILDSCYYARLSGLSGDLDDLITNNNATGQFYVTVEASDYALQTGCKLTLTDE